MAMTYGSIDKSKDKITLTFTKEEVLFIQDTLKEFRNNITWNKSASQEIMTEDYDGLSELQLRILDKIITKFATA